MANDSKEYNLVFLKTFIYRVRLKMSQIDTLILGISLP